MAQRRALMIRVVTGIALLATLAGAAPAFAEDARVEAARKEGKVVWYTSLAAPTAEKVAKLFEAAYPGIKVETQRTGSQRILQRVMQELSAKAQEGTLTAAEFLVRVKRWPTASCFPEVARCLTAAAFLVVVTRWLTASRFTEVA